MYENEMKSGYPVHYDPDYAYDDENMPIPEQEPDEQALAFQKEIEEREAFMQEHMTLPDGTTDLTTFGWTSLRRLMCKELPSIRYIVDGLLPQGLAILASPPKYGKSWLALDLCISVALGEPFFGRKTEPCDTLYLALEDSEQRLQSRGQTVLGDRLPPENCYIGTLAGSLADRLPHQIEAFLHRWPNIGLIVIDTFQKVRVSARAGSNLYDKDYSDMGILKNIADAHNICILLVHHLRKAPEPGDPFVRILGTQGINGASDTNFVMVREERSDDITHFYSAGRDVISEDLELQFDKQTCRWHPVANKAARTAEERYRADPLVQTAERLVRENPAGWQGTASELTGWVKETTGVNFTAVSLSKQMRNLRDNLLMYDNIVYNPPERTHGAQRTHVLYRVKNCPKAS